MLFDERLFLGRATGARKVKFRAKHFVDGVLKFSKLIGLKTLGSKAFITGAFSRCLSLNSDDN